MNNLTEIKQIPDKKEIQSIAIREAREMIEAGTENPLLLRIHIKRMIEFLTVYDKEIDEACREEAEKFDEKSFEFQGAKIELAEVGTKYDYSKDELWNRINSEFKEVEGRRKAHEELIKRLPKITTIVDEETGETYTLIPPVKTSKSSIKVTL